ncbi:MAG: hypothetical protein ABI700_02950 [Chloroflexota bacterium]
MKKYRLHVLAMALLLCLVSGLVFAQDADTPPNPADVRSWQAWRSEFDVQDAQLDPAAPPSLPTDMESALVPCGEGVTGPCDRIATKPEDITGVWKQYLGGPRFSAPSGMAYIRYNADGTYVMADSVEHTAHPFGSYPSGTYQFDGAQFIIGPAVDAPPLCTTAPHYQLRILKYGDRPVALRYVSIDDTCPGRLQDLSQALVWVSGA